MSTALTGRDKVWNATLQAISEANRDYITSDDVRAHLDDDDVDNMTRERTMWSMVDLGYLSHEKRAKKWFIAADVDVQFD
ncbi:MULTISPECIES: hypothetical protein [Halorussus]|uniref:hypothetical protein n=1 Tax=Halorussus TaxID=1070314 RepID=UPI0020A16285|nr:hypothetical protein [Halorussus vallis]USZ74043.1 hypothetical protein NGM07_11305 [Halorussus vallis]